MFREALLVCSENYAQALLAKSGSASISVQKFDSDVKASKRFSIAKSAWVLYQPGSHKTSQP